MPSWHTSGAVVTVLVLSAALAVIPTAAASAHEQLLSSSPIEGERLEVAPDQVRLQFAADLLGLGAVILVADAEGTNWVLGEAVVEGPVATIAVDPDMPVGGYEVRWRVVSGDGHPISDVIPFTVGDAAPLVTDNGSATTTGPQTAAATSAEEGSAILRVLLIGLGGAVAAGGVYALLTSIRKARK